jgi:hypothetical protein
MPSLLDFPARGQVIEARNNTIVFQPQGTTYQMHLLTEEPYAGTLHVPVNARIRVSARKIYTVPSGGNFVQPIFGPPRIVQGRVKFIDDSSIIVHAGVAFVVDLPGADSAIDLTEGQIRVGHIVNAVVLPGATFELIDNAVASASANGQ